MLLCICLGIGELLLALGLAIFGFFKLIRRKCANDTGDVCSQNKRPLARLGDIDITDPEQREQWFSHQLKQARERIQREEYRLREMGIIDEAGDLATSDLPLDMRPGSKTDTAT